MIKINILSECEFIFFALILNDSRDSAEKEFAQKIYGRRLVPSICIPATGCSINLRTKKAKALQKFETQQEEGEVDRMLCHLSLRKRLLIHNTIELM